jgi:hypothetical protein
MSVIQRKNVRGRVLFSLATHLHEECGHSMNPAYFLFDPFTAYIEPALRDELDKYSEAVSSGESHD